MAHIDGQVLIRRPVEEVFDFVADERTEPTYDRNMAASEKLTDGPIEVETRVPGNDQQPCSASPTAASFMRGTATS